MPLKKGAFIGSTLPRRAYSAPYKCNPTSAHCPVRQKTKRRKQHEPLTPTLPDRAGASMTNRGNDASRSSLPSDLTRVVLLGIAFDLSRCVAREMLGALWTPYADDDTNGECQDDAVTHRSISTDRATARKRKGGGIIKGSEHFVERWNFLFHRFKRSQPKNACTARRTGVYCYHLLPPPMFMYGAWSHLLRRENKPPITSSICGTCISSIFLWYAFPRLLSWTNDCEPSPERRHNNRRQQNHDSTTEKNSAGSQTTTSPLHKTIVDEEYRPRSDSLQSAMSEGSVRPQEASQQFLELLVHNVSHTDFILGLGSSHEGADPTSKEDVPLPSPAEFEDAPRKRNSSPHDNSNGSKDSDECILCRPRFSAFDLFSRRVLNELQDEMESSSVGCLDSDNSAATSHKHPLYQKILAKPRYERSNETARHTLVTPRPSDQFELPVGFDLRRTEGAGNTTIKPGEMQHLRLRGRDVQRVNPSLLGKRPTLQTMHSAPINEADVLQSSVGGSVQDKLQIKAVFFPLLSILLPRWLGQIADKFGGDKKGVSTEFAARQRLPLHSPHVKKVVVLVSGVGTPRNWTHSISGNSTKVCAELMELFIRALYPDITVVR